MLGGVVLASDAVTVDIAGAIGMPQGFSDEGAVGSVTGLDIRSALLNHGLLHDVTEAVILSERRDAAGVDGLLQDQRSIGAKVFNQHALPRWIVDHMLGGVVLAGDAITVDIARAIGVAEGFGDQCAVGSVAGLDIFALLNHGLLRD